MPCCIAPAPSLMNCNVVRFRIKPGREERFFAAHRDGRADWPGLVRGAIIKTGEDGYCLIGEWAEPGAIAAACNSMIETLNSFRDTLDAAGPGQGVTDAVSGAVVLELPQKR